VSINITVILPAKDEADRIGATIAAIKSSAFVNRIIVIDDGSTDQTYEIAETLGVEAYRLPRNFGKGYAVNYGISKSILNSDIIVFLDADLGASAKEIDKLIIPVLHNEADVTIAKFPQAQRKGGFGFVKNLARYGVHFYTGQMIYTSLSGQRAFKSDVLEKLGKFPLDYGIEIGMTIDILRKGYRIKEVEVNMTHRETGRDMVGFIHRGKQFYQIFMVLIRKARKE
jgi:GT2 family glycosyltransferase